MSNNDIYCDGISEISFANGVVRLHLVQIQGNSTVPAGTVFMPLNLVQPLADNLMNAARQLAPHMGGGFAPAPVAPAPTQAGADFLASIPKLT
ncbi:MAG: hypothetical protein ACT7A5_32875 [Ferrovibrionaceae bacterium]